MSGVRNDLVWRPGGQSALTGSLSAPFGPLVPAATETVEVVAAAHLRAMAIDVDPNLAPGAAPRAPALLREGPGRETREHGRSRSRGNSQSPGRPAYVAATSSRARGVTVPRARGRAHGRPRRIVSRATDGDRDLGVRPGDQDRPAVLGHDRHAEGRGRRGARADPCRAGVTDA